MTSVLRSLVMLAAALMLLSAVPVPSSAQTLATVTGSVTDELGAPISNASVSLAGPASKTTTSDTAGAFAFSGVTPGIYVLTVTKAGYTSAVQNDIVLLAGQTTNLAVRLPAATFSSLRTIASVRANGRGTLNTAAASVDVATTQTFENQAQPQVTRVLSQMPGLQISFPSNSANAAAPGSITIPNIRGATSYETASLIDGHPISVGQYGDNVTTFLNTFMFGSVELIKGPGADSPEVNNAIGGTTNFRTKDPTLTPTTQVLFGIDNRGGSLSNFSIADTVGKLGFVLDFATDYNPSALNGKQVYYDPSGGVINGASLSGNTSYSNVPGTASSLPTTFPLLACCWTLQGNLDQTAELAKLRYKFSPATTLTLSYLGGQSFSDQNGNTSDLVNGVFAPGDPSYSGSLKPGPMLIATNLFPGVPNSEFNNEPITQAEISTTVGKDSLLARYYHASISRYQFQGADFVNPDYNVVNLYGVSAAGPGGVNATFNGTPNNVGYFDAYQEPELDKLTGGSFEYQHPIGGNGLLTFSAERTFSQSTDYSIFSGPFYAFNLPPGTSQILTTYLLRGHFYVNPKLDVTLSNYLNTYSSTYPVACAGGDCNNQPAAQFGTGVTFGTNRNAHYDPRIGLVFRPNLSTAIRFSAGSAIAPPFLGLLNQITSTPVYDPSTGVAIEGQSNGNLKPETAFGYDLGADVRLKDQVTLVSGDLYYTNLFNRFFGQTLNTGLVCGAPNAPTCQSTGGPIPPNTPILNQTNTNISNARFEGIELAIRRQPAAGFGYTIAGALQKGYYYNLPPYFYCSIPGPGCTQDQNLNIISGQNTNGIPVGFYNVSYNGNMRIPYSQAYGEISYTFRSGAYAALGDTYYGNNNSLNRPPFGIAYASVRYPITQSMSLQLSGDNIFNAYPGYLPILGAGNTIPLVGQLPGATTGNVLGPATWRLVLSTKLP